MQQNIQNIELNPQLLVTCSQIIGVTSFNQYLYAFFPFKISIFENLTHRSNPELIEEIHLPRPIKLFDLTQQYIVVLFQNGDLEVRKRGYWQVMIYSNRINANVHYLKISGNKIVFKEQQDNKKVTYIFLDMKNEIEDRLWHQQEEFEKLIYINQLGNIPDFFVGYRKEKKLEFGILYGDNDNILKSFQFGIVALQSKYDIQNIYLIQINETFWLIQLYQNAKENNEQLLLRINKFYQKTPLYQKQELQKGEKNQYKLYEDMLEEMKQIQSNMNQVAEENTRKEQKKILQVLIKNEGLYQNCFIKNNIIWVCTQKCVHLIQIKQNSIVERIKSKNKYSICDIYENGFVYESKCLMINSYQTKSDSFKKEKKEQPQAQIQAQVEVEVEAQKQAQVQNKENNDEQEVQVEQINIKVQNGNKVKQWEKKEQSQQSSLSIEPIKKQLSIHSAFNLQISSPKEKVELEEEGTQTQDKNIVLCPKKHQNSIHKLQTKINELNLYLSQTMMSSISQCVVNQHSLIKENCRLQLKQFTQNLLQNYVTPIINTKMQEIIAEKMKQSSSYINILATHNLVHLNQSIEREKLKEEMVKNEYMRKQQHEITELKKVIQVVVNVCKKRQQQNVILFQHVKQSFQALTNRVISLQSKVQQLISKQEISQSKLFDQIQIIKSMIKSKHLPSSHKGIEHQAQNNSQESESSSEPSQSEPSQSQQIENISRQYPPHHHPHPHSQFRGRKRVIEPYPNFNYVPVPMISPQQYSMPGYGSGNMSYGNFPQMYMQGVPNYFMPQMSMPSQLKRQYVRMNHYSQLQNSIEQENLKARKKKKQKKGFKK